MMKAQERHNRFVSAIETRTWRGDIPAEYVNHIFNAYALACYPSHDKRGHNSTWAVLSQSLRERFNSLKSTRISAAAAEKSAAKAGEGSGSTI